MPREGPGVKRKLDLLPASTWGASACTGGVVAEGVGWARSLCAKGMEEGSQDQTRPVTSKESALGSLVAVLDALVGTAELVGPGWVGERQRSPFVFFFARRSNGQADGPWPLVKPTRCHYNYTLPGQVEAKSGKHARRTGPHNRRGVPTRSSHTHLVACGTGVVAHDIP